MKNKTLIYNAKIYTQADLKPVESMTLYKNRIVAIGKNLNHDPDFAKFNKIDMKGKTIIPGLVDAHTHFYFLTIALSRVNLQGLDSIEACLDKIKKFASTLGKNEWVVGEGYTPDLFKKRIEPDRYMLDNVTSGRPSFIFSKDQHTAWTNSKALALAGISSKTKVPAGGDIVFDTSGQPTGLLREKPAYMDVYQLIPHPSKNKINKLYQQALKLAYQNGVTGVHSFDSPAGYEYFQELAQKNKLGLRINYYYPGEKIDELLPQKAYYGKGDEFLRLAGLKLFSDGALGSQTALCFNKYIGSKNNFGIEVSTTEMMAKVVKKAVKLGLPCAIHAIGDKAVDNVITTLESAPNLYFGARHRIEHLQLVRKKDIARIKKANIIASMQPSHCPSDIKMIYKYWGSRSANSFLFRTIQNKKIDLAFGSDAPIEPLVPLHGIAAAVRRALPNSRDVFNPDEKISVAEALYHYTVGSAIAVGQEHCRGYLLPGYPADFVVLSDDIHKIAPGKIYDTKVLMTVIDGKIKYKLKD